jgi:hypothetical protein
VSLSGAFSKLSKLVLIAVMIRGRHRGLPVAIDRAVLLPRDLEFHELPEDEDLEGDLDAGHRQSFGGTEMTRVTDAEAEADYQYHKHHQDGSGQMNGDENPTGNTDGTPGVSFALPEEQHRRSSEELSTVASSESQQHESREDESTG